MRKITVVAAAILSGLSTLAACGPRQPETAQHPVAAQQPAGEQPKQTVPDCNAALKFINAYTAHCLPGADRTPDSAWIATNELLTTSFKAAYKKMRDDAFKADPELGMDADPIFDAQDFPDKGFELVSCDTGGGYVVVRGKEWRDFKVTLRVVLQNSRWLVDGAGVINIPDEKLAPR